MTLNVPHFDPFSFATNLSKNTIGFDELFTKFTDMTKAAGYPPYNIKKTGDNTYVIEMAVAGFGRQDIELVLEDGVLSIKGEVKSDEKNDYLFKGIADRAFTRKFTLADTIEIKKVTLADGILTISLENVVPESQKSRSIPIS